MISQYKIWLPIVVVALFVVQLQADEPKTTKVELSDGKITLTAPSDWKSVQPRNNIIQYEFIAPADEQDKEKQCRITFTAATGGIEANIERWYGQFQQPDSSSTKDKSKVEKMEVSGQTVHLVDIPGTFKDTMGGPFFQNRPPVMRENYRMLGAIVETKNAGTHFIKVTGPADQVEKQLEGFKKMLKGLEVKG